MINPMDMTGRTVLVTGASSGLGRETSILLSQLGARIILVGRREEELKKTQSLLTGSDHVIEVYDLKLVKNIPDWMKSVTRATGPLNGLVHSAGMLFTLPLRATAVENFEELMSVNATSAFSLTKGYRQKGVCTSPSSVVYLSSVAAMVGQPGQASYAASKGALCSMTKSLAMELAREGIRVNCVAPALILTEMVESLKSTLIEEQFEKIKAYHPLGLGDPRDVANAVAFLLADTGRWITGTTLVVDGGYTAH